MKAVLEIVILAFILVLVGFFVMYSFFEEPERVSFSEPSVLERLTLDQKIGQLFIIGFEGKAMNSEIEALLEEIHPGGVLLLKRNIEDGEQLKELIISLQKAALNDTGLPLLIAVDQEGGEVSRINWIEKTPQSEIESAEHAYNIGKERGEELKELGINLNLAPLLDIVSSKDFLFERAFHDSEIIKEFAQELIKGQRDSGIATAIKHFPGYGGISFNPEEKLAVLEQIPRTSQFINGSEMIMTSNVVYKEIDEKPFSFSEKGIQLLRDKIKGNYLIISDDLSQNSLLNEYSLEEIVSLPIKAGTDMLIFSGWKKPVEQGVSAFKQGDISEKRINQSVQKIIKLKQSF